MSDHITKAMKERRAKRERAHRRLRQRIRGTPERPRLSVYKSLKFIYAQVIDDVGGTTLAEASSSDPAIRGQVGSSTSSKAAAKLVGAAVAERAKAKGIAQVVFDRGGYIYHGRVQAVADGAREKGLQF
jgi:large subunit ribosomal protein L18